jgi:hypothetical protein
MAPGLMSMAGVLAIMMPPVSDCHQLSWNGRPKTFCPQTTHSAFRGSPTLARKRKAPKSRPAAASGPARISIRMAVGAVYQTCTRSASRMPYQRSSSNSASSTTAVARLASGATMP